MTAEHDRTNQQPPHVSGTIKALEWLGANPDYSRADCVFGRHEIINTYDDRDFMLYLAGSKSAEYHPTLEAAKAAAQADYQAHILAAIQPDPLPILDRVPLSPSFSCGDVELTATTDKSGPVDGLEAPTPDPQPVASEPEGRWETGMEHIARDMREGRFPERSERQRITTPSSAPASAPASVAAQHQSVFDPATENMIGWLLDRDADRIRLVDDFPNRCGLDMPLNDPDDGQTLEVATLEVEDSGYAPALWKLGLAVLRRRRAER